MHSIRSRLNVIATAGTTTLAVAAAVMALSSVIADFTNPPTPAIKLEAASEGISLFPVEIAFTQRNRHTVDRAVIPLDIVGDFTSCFGWNAKVLYVCVVGIYSTPRFSRNEVTLWDKVLNNVSEGKIHERQALEYPLDDIGTALRGANLTIQLRYQIMTYSGLSPIRYIPGTEITVRLPSQYVRHASFG